MRRIARTFATLFPVALVLAACAGPAAPPRDGEAGPPPSSAPGGRNSVTIAYGAEINNLGSKIADGVWASDYNLMTNVSLTVKNPLGVAIPRLAAELPSQANGNWVVNADGTMRTTWKLKPNAIWQDGQPITPRDFVFGHRIAVDERMPIGNRRPESAMERIERVDDQTFVIHWKQPYPWANELGTGQLEPLPDHIMGRVHETAAPEAFLAHPFWISPEYVGAGPYRLVRWDAGSQLVFHAFDGYILGRPKIDEVVFRIIPDPNAVVANLLAGEAHSAINIALGQQAGAVLKEQWSRSGDGAVLAIPTRFRHLDVQLKPEDLAQPALLDVRVRRAIIHGLDRATLAEIATAGMTEMTDVFLPPTHELHRRVMEVVPKYPYDTNRALALLREAGWARQGDSLADSGGRQFTIDILSSEGSDNEIEQGIIASDLRKVGMQVTETIYPRSRANDREFRAKFPALNPSAQQIEVPDTLSVMTSQACPNPATRYSGNNRGCWRNAEFDRLYEVMTTSLNANERNDALIRGHLIINEELGKIPLSYRADAMAFRKGLVGPGSRVPGQGDLWNIHEWRWE